MERRMTYTTMRVYGCFILCFISTSRAFIVEPSRPENVSAFDNCVHLLLARFIAPRGHLSVLAPGEVFDRQTYQVPCTVFTKAPTEPSPRKRFVHDLLVALDRNNQFDGRSVSDVLFLTNWSPDSLVIVTWVDPPQDLTQVFDLFDHAWSAHVLNIVALVTNATAEKVRLYTYFPFTTSRCVDLTPRFVGDCGSEGADPFPDGKLDDLHGCPIRVSTLHQPPIYELVTDAVTGKLSVRGMSGLLLNALVDKMNFTPVVRDAKRFGSWYGNVTSEPGIVRDLITRRADLGLFSFRGWMSNGFELSMPAAVSCATWAIPMWAGSQKPFYRSVTQGFLPAVWFSVLLSMACMPVMTFFYLRIFGRRGHWTLSFSIIAFLIEQPISSTHPYTSRAKAFLAAWMLYGIVLTCSYKASLKKIMALRYGSQIESLEELYSSGLNLIGTSYFKNVLSSDSDGTIEKALAQKMTTVSQDKSVLLAGRLFKERDVAIFWDLNEMELISYRVYWQKFHTIPNYCAFQASVAPFIMRERSFLLRPVNEMVLALSAQGISRLWARKVQGPGHKLRMMQMELRPFSLHKLRGPFVLLVIGQLASFISFLAERLFAAKRDIRVS